MGEHRDGPTPDDGPFSVAVHDRTEARIVALEETVMTLAGWLVEAQTGFAARDVVAIDNLIKKARQAHPFSNAERDRAG